MTNGRNIEMLNELFYGLIIYIAFTYISKSCIPFLSVNEICIIYLDGFIWANIDAMYLLPK